MVNSLTFLRNFLRNPRATGAIAPATSFLASSVAAAAQRAYAWHEAATGASGAGLKLIELGAGTGALSLYLHRLNPVLVEKDAGSASLLRKRFPELEVRQECATLTLGSLHEPVGVVTSIPLLNNPQSAQLRQLLAARYAEGLLKFCVLYTYGFRDPLSGTGFRRARRVRFVTRSLPPAHVWLYQ